MKSNYKTQNGTIICIYFIVNSSIINRLIEQWKKLWTMVAILKEKKRRTSTLGSIEKLSSDTSLKTREREKTILFYRT